MLVKTAWLSLPLLLAERSMRLKTGETGAKGRVEGVAGPGDIIAPSPSLSPNTTNLPWLTTNARKGGRLPSRIKRPLLPSRLTAGLSDRGAGEGFSNEIPARSREILISFLISILESWSHWITKYQCLERARRREMRCRKGDKSVIKFHGVFVAKKLYAADERWYNVAILYVYIYIYWKRFVAITL